jgi:hypothetical protein
MLIKEVIDSDEQILGIVKSILMRAKSEGAKQVDMNQLVNDIGDSSVTPELLVDIFSRHGAELKNIVAGATVDMIDLDTETKKSMQYKSDTDAAKLKGKAVQQAKQSLNKPNLAPQKTDDWKL